MEEASTAGKSKKKQQDVIVQLGVEGDYDLNATVLSGLFFTILKISLDMLPLKI